MDEFEGAGQQQKIKVIEKLLRYKGLYIHHIDKKTKKIILSDSKEFQYPHEHHTSKKLAAADYNVLFTPKGYFKRQEKKHDIFLIKWHLMLAADLKCIYTTNPDTIDKRIKEGSDQAERIVLDIHSNIEKMRLIDGLRLGCQRNELLTQILLFYKSQFLVLNREQIIGKNIFKVLK